MMINLSTSPVGNFPIAARVVCRRCLGRAAKTGGDHTGVRFGKRPGRAADAHLLLLAGSQHSCSVDRAEALKV